LLVKMLSILFLFLTLKPGKSHGRERLSTVDLRVLTSLDQPFYILKVLFTLKRSTVLSLPPHLVFPAAMNVEFKARTYVSGAPNITMLYGWSYSQTTD
jgi:hypothetical protein